MGVGASGRTQRSRPKSAQTLPCEEIDEGVGELSQPRLQGIEQFQARLPPSLADGTWVLKVDGESGDAVYEDGFEAQYL
eukprot:SAG31_NODE_15868_length_734_cov_1.074016_1_plen_79_part_00